MSDNAVLVDTDVWSHLFWQRRNEPPQVTEWRRALAGRDIVIAAQTEAELRFGALAAEWGQSRSHDLEERLRRTPTLPVTVGVIEHHASIRAECRKRGHALGAKVHMGDAWVAATARAFGLPILAADGIYVDAPGLRLFAV